MIRKLLEKTTKEIKKQRGFNKELHRDLFDTYNEVWSGSEFVAVAEGDLHCIILDYVAAVFVAGTDDERTLTVEKVSHAYEFVKHRYFPDEELFEGTQSNDGYFLKVYKEKNGRGFAE